MILSDVLETRLLATREPSAAKLRRIQAALSEIKEFRLPLPALAEAAMAECKAQSAGVTLFRRGPPIESEWIVAAGVVSEFTGSRFPLRHSLCGVAADLSSIQLFVRPQRYFQWIEHAGIYISESLVAPLVDADGRRFGTVWAMSHQGARRKFDRGDAAMLEGIAAAASAVLLPDPSTSRTGRSFRLSVPSPGPTERRCCPCIA